MIFAGASAREYSFWLERVEPIDPAALDRWKALSREGWDVTALVDEPPPGTHLIGLGHRYPDQDPPQGGG